MANLNGTALRAQADILRRAAKAGRDAASLEAFVAAIERRAAQLEGEALTATPETAPRAVLHRPTKFLYHYVPGEFRDDAWVWLFEGQKTR